MTRVSRDSERGAAMLVTLILISALLAGAAVLVSLQLASNRSTEVTRSSMTALYCAEAGIVAARPVVAANRMEWIAAIAASGAGDTSQPAFLGPAAFSHDLDGDGADDFEVYLKDNDDETGATNDPQVDIDQRIFIISRCIKFPDMPKSVGELVQASGGGNCYESQEGGCGGNGNFN